MLSSSLKKGSARLNLMATGRIAVRSLSDTTAPLGTAYSKLTLGVPKETFPLETRVAGTPEVSVVVVSWREEGLCSMASVECKTGIQPGWNCFGMEGGVEREHCGRGGHVACKSCPLSPTITHTMSPQMGSFSRTFMFGTL